MSVDKIIACGYFDRFEIKEPQIALSAYDTYYYPKKIEIALETDYNRLKEFIDVLHEQSYEANLRSRHIALKDAWDKYKMLLKLYE